MSKKTWIILLLLGTMIVGGITFLQGGYRFLQCMRSDCNCPQLEGSGSHCKRCGHSYREHCLVDLGIK